MERRMEIHGKDNSQVRSKRGKIIKIYVNNNKLYINTTI